MPRGAVIAFDELDNPLWPGETLAMLEFHSKYNLYIPEIDLNEPLSKLANYIYKSIKNNENHLFRNNFNEKVTRILEKINKNND